MEIYEIILKNYNYWIFIILMFTGLYGVIAKNNIIKKLIGMNIFQTSIILFYVSLSAKLDGTIPIITETDKHKPDTLIDAANYMNPLPHVLMLTAIVVSVATIGVALALAIKVYRTYETLEEDEIRRKIASGYTGEN
ncbi:MAG: cation:proton antiporter subunit C [Desulforegulaceae bacterium]|nr:cation:proton antiporter subunit C [Desulforegulaceae bacterium]